MSTPSHTRRISASKRVFRLFVCLVALALVLSGLARAANVNLNFMSDPHYDPAYGSSSGYGTCKTSSSPEYGSTGCDSPYRLLTSVTSDMVAQNSSFTVMAGDWQRHDMSTYSTSAQTVFRTLSILFSALTRSGQMTSPTFMGILGNNDVIPDYYFDVNSTNHPYLNDQTMYMRQFSLLTTTEEALMRQCGYFSRQPTASLRVIGMHTNVWLVKLQPAQPDTLADPCGQFAWMQAELDAARAAGQKVLLLGHVPPQPDVFGVISRGTLTSAATDMYWKPLYQQTYTDMVRANSDIISAQVFGHTHRFSFVADPLLGVPLFVLNGVTPLYGNAPAYMVATFDDATWALNELIQHTKTTVGTAPVWVVQQGVRAAMGLTSLSDVSVMNTEVARLTSDDTLWNNYMQLRTGGVIDDPCTTDFCRIFTVCAMRFSTFANLQVCVDDGVIPTVPTTTTTTSAAPTTTTTTTTTTTQEPPTTTTTTTTAPTPTTTTTTTEDPTTTTSTTTTTTTTTEDPTTTTTTTTSAGPVPPVGTTTTTTGAPDTPSNARPQPDLSATIISAAVSAAQPIFHVRPPTNWINDPNGAYRDPVTGRIHLYMQYNPYSALWGNMSWYHVTSDDYVHWYREDELAMINDKWYDQWGVYSGTMMNNLYGEPVAVYTCVEVENIQRQCIANPSKEDLEGKRTLNTLYKSPLNVVMSEDDIPNLVKLENFRDPTEWWEDPANPGNWLIAFVARIDDEEGDNAHVIVFTTDDPTFQSNYKFSHSIYVYKYDLDHMFECPDFFVLSDPSNTGNTAAEHFLKVSTMPSHRDYIMYGTYAMNNETNQYDFFEDPDRSFTFMDYGPFYASKSFWDPILEKRFVWGWTNEEMSDDRIELQGWSGVQNMLRGMEYDEVEQKLKTRPQHELRGLRGERLVQGTYTLPSDGTPLDVLAPSAAGLTRYHEIIVNFTLSDPQAFLDAVYTPNGEATAAPEFGLQILRNAAGDVYTSVALRMPPAASATAYTDLGQSGLWPAFKIYPLEASMSAADGTANCTAQCQHDRTCEAWTYNATAHSCVLYWKSNDLLTTAASDCVSNVVREPWLYFGREQSSTVGYTDPLHGRAPFATATPNSVALHVFVDASVVEVFKDDGLETLTGRAYVQDNEPKTGIALYAKNMAPESVTATITVFSMTSIWASPQSTTSAWRNFTNAFGAYIGNTMGRSD